MRIGELANEVVARQAGGTVEQLRDDPSKIQLPYRGAPTTERMYPQDNAVTMRTRSGILVRLSMDRLPEAMQKGYTPLSVSEIAAAVNSGKKIEDYVTGSVVGPPTHDLRRGRLTPLSSLGMGGLPEAKAASYALTGSGKVDPGEMLPAAAAMGAGLFLGPEASLAREVLTTGGAAMAGSALVHPTKPGTALTKGIEYGAFPAVASRAIAYPIRHLMVGELGHVPKTAEEWAAANYLFPSRNVSGRALREEVEDLATKTVQEVIGSAVPSTPIQSSIQRTVRKIGAPLFKDAAQSALTDMKMVTRGINVDTLPMKQEATRMLAEVRRPMTLAARRGGKPALLKTQIPSPAVTNLLVDTLKLPDQVGFMDAFELRKRWYTMSKEPDELIGREPKSMFSKAVSDLTTAMDNAVSGNAQAKSAWTTFRDMYRSGAGLLQSQTISRVLKEHPENVASTITDYTSASDLKDAAVNYAMKWGDPQQQFMAQLAWKNFQSDFMDYQLSKGGIFKLSDNLNSLGRDTLNVMYDDQVGAQMLKNARTISDAVKRMDDLASRRNVYWIHSFLSSVPDHVMSHVLHDPTEYTLYMRGITGLLRESDKATRRGVGDYLYEVTPESAKAIALIGRAWLLASESESAPTPNGQARRQRRTAQPQVGPTANSQ